MYNLIFEGFEKGLDSKFYCHFIATFQAKNNKLLNKVFVCENNQKEINKLFKRVASNFINREGW